MNSSNFDLTGMFKAIVTDTSMFKSTGKIKTRISALNGYGVTSNLTNNYDSDTYSKLLSRDSLTSIMMPFGGGNNYGMFKLPQVNSVGIVTFLNNNPAAPVWIGSIANETVKNGVVTELDYPTDNLDKNFGAFSTEGGETVFNFNDENSFVIKLKKNSLDDFSKPETMDWKSNPVENAMIMSEEKIQLRHDIINSKDNTITGSYGEIIFSKEADNENENKENSYVSLRNYIDNNSEKFIKLDSDDITFQNKNGSLLTVIRMTEDGHIIIQTSENNKEQSKIELAQAQIILESGKAKINIRQGLNQSQSEVAISAPKVRISAENISLGSTGYSLLATPSSNIALTMEDGTMLTTINNIKV